MILHLTPFIALICLVGALDLEEEIESDCKCGHPTRGTDFGGPTFIEGLKNSASAKNEIFSMVLNSIYDPRFGNLMKYHTIGARNLCFSSFVSSNRVDQHVCYKYYVRSDSQLEVSNLKPIQEPFCQYVDGFKQCTIKSHEFSTEGYILK